MPQVVSVSFRFSPKPLWFDPKGKDYELGAQVLVETERGREVGTIANPCIEATDKEISKLKSSLKPVIRELNDLDLEHVQVLDEKGKIAMPYFREKVEEYELDIKPVEIQYLFSGERAVFYFSSEERVDFRDLVRDLAQHFHVRIDMRQIGARDEAKELGGLAHCGQEFCCTRFGGEFQPVSIRMAKEQDLPLNPTKISGACGRLMCCLRYEYEAYKDFKKRAPKKGTPVDTPLGEAVISGYNTPSETMELRLRDGKRLSVPLAEMNCEKGGEGCGRCSVDHETVERCASKSILIALGSLGQSDDSRLSLTDETAADVKSEASGGERKRRRRTPSKATEAAAASTPRPAHAAQTTQASTERSTGEKPSTNNRKRRRRTPSGGTSTSTQKQNTQQSSQNKTNSAPNAENKNAASPRTDKPRPGQRSSGLRRRHSAAASDNQSETKTTQAAHSSAASKPTASKPTTNKSAANVQTSSTPDATRRKRRRHEGSGSKNGAGQGSRSDSVQGSGGQNGSSLSGSGQSGADKSRSDNASPRDQ